MYQHTSRLPKQLPKNVAQNLLPRPYVIAELASLEDLVLVGNIYQIPLPLPLFSPPITHEEEEANNQPA